MKLTDQSKPDRLWCFEGCPSVVHSVQTSQNLTDCGAKGFTQCTDQSKPDRLWGPSVVHSVQTSQNLTDCGVLKGAKVLYTVYMYRPDKT